MIQAAQSGTWDPAGSPARSGSPISFVAFKPCAAIAFRALGAYKRASPSSFVF
jgi:hypothetical protein